MSTFYGIDIYLYHNETEHLGRPHFHARYAEHKASITVDGNLCRLLRLRYLVRRLGGTRGAGRRGDEDTPPGRR